MGSLRIGLVSDTHGLLRAEALAALEGSDRIVHAGDIGSAAVLDALAKIAPVVAVRGNNDTGEWAEALGESARLEDRGVSIHVVHDLADLAIDPRSEGIGVVVHGHSHRPGIATRDGVLYVNPGSAGPRRFRLPISVGRLTLADGKVEPQLIELCVVRG